MPRGVNNIHPHLDLLEGFVDAFFLPLLPKAGRCRRCNRNSPLPLLLHPIRHRGPLMDLADLMDHPSIKENSLGQRGLASINVRSNSNVSRPLKRILTVWRIRIGNHGKRIRHNEMELIKTESEQTRGSLGPSYGCRRAF